MKKKLGLYVAGTICLLFIAAVFSACSKAGGSSDKVSIRIMTRWSDDAPYSKFWRSKLEEFNKTNADGITITDESLSDESAFLDKLRSSIATGNQPEIFIEYGGSRIVDYVEAGILLDVQPYLDADPAWRDSFLDDLFDKWHFENYPGTFGIPTQFYAVFLFYNKKILADAGFTAPPENIDEWRHMCDVLLAKGQQPMTLGEKDNWRGGHFVNNLVMKSYGAQGVIDISNRSMNYDDPRMIKLFAITKEFNDKGYFGPNAVGVDAGTEDADFLNNKIAMRFIGSWFIPQIVSDYQGDISNVGVARFPYINPQFRDSYQGGTAEAYSISKRDKTNDASIKVVKYLTNSDYWAEAERYNQGGLYVSKFKSLPDTKIDPVTVAAKALLVEAKEFRDDIQTYDPESHMLDTARAAIQGLFIGNTPEQAAREIVGKEQIK
jgi:ABC-type glycerol-3-phosphate transport system substrate-binding protein